MTDKQPIAKAGSLLMIDRGVFSDYSVLGFFVVLKAFNAGEKCKNYLKAYKRENSNLYDRIYIVEDGFIPYLIEHGYLLEIEYSNLFLSQEEVSFRLAAEE